MNIGKKILSILTDTTNQTNEELVAAFEHAAAALGVEQLFRAYLKQAFGVETACELNTIELAVAFTTIRAWAALSTHHNPSH